MEEPYSFFLCGDSGKKKCVGIYYDRSLYIFGLRGIFKIYGPSQPEAVYKAIRDCMGKRQVLFEKQYQNVANPQKLELASRKNWFFLKDQPIDREYISALSRMGIWILEKGWLRVRFREKDDKDGDLVFEIFQNVRSISKAVRKFDKIIRRYQGDAGRQNGEKHKLSGVQSNLEEASDLIEEINGRDPEKKNKIDRMLVRYAAELAGKRKKFLQDAETYLLESSALEDSKARFNPGASLARMLAADSLIAKRIGDIGGLTGFSRMRREQLSAFLDFMEFNRRRALNRVNRAIELILKQDNSGKSKNIALFTKACNLAIYSCYRFWVSPYYARHQDLVNRLEEAKNKARLGQTMQSLEDLVSARHMLLFEIREDK